MPLVLVPVRFCIPDQEYAVTRLEILRSIIERAGRKLSPARLVPEVLRRVGALRQQIKYLEGRVRSIQEALGRIEARQISALPAGGSLQEREFRVYSQWGEDGIIQYLTSVVPIARRIFVEFGVESYQEANTRFLLINDNWAGLVIDGNGEQIEQLRHSREYWLYNLKAAHAFITRENINSLLTEHGISGEIGLLSIDLDGMDYWVWDAIEVIDPAIVVVEYNSRFGRDDAVTVPYDPQFDRRTAHHSLLYYGASLKALALLGKRKGYSLVGCGSAGLNAFFVRNDLRPECLPDQSPEEAYLVGQFCEAHDADGTRIKMSHEDQMRLVRSLPLVNVEGCEREQAATVQGNGHA